MSKSRILIVGSTGYSKEVAQHEWGKIPKGLNVTDFDVVLFDLAGLSVSDGAAGMPGPAANLPSSFGAARQMSSNGGVFIFVGVPRKTFCKGIIPHFSPLQHWCPVYPQAAIEAGTTVAVVDERFAAYFQQVTRTDFCIRSGSRLNLTNDDFLKLETGATGLHLGDHRALATNRAGDAIAFSVHWTISVQHAASQRRGRYFWFPPVTNTTQQQGNLLLLEAVGATRPKQDIPAWARARSLPSIERATVSLTTARTNLIEATKRLDAANDELLRETRFLGLLYLQGEELEQIVNDALEKLGATIRRPTRKGREDGYLTDPSGRKAVLEIKGRTGALQLSDVRQLEQWVDEADDLSDDRKGILVGNLQCGKAPEERNDFLPPNASDRARRLGFSVLLTTDIFAALRRIQNGAFDSARFWQRIFETEGICDFDEA